MSNTKRIHGQVKVMAILVMVSGVLGLLPKPHTAKAVDETPRHRLTECVKKSRETNELESDLSVLFLVDTSSSLRRLDGGPGTDPDGKRAEVLSVVTDLLSQTRQGKLEESGSGTKVDVAFLDFGEAVGFSKLSGDKLSGWMPVGEFVSRGGSDAIRKYFPSATHALNTDYVRALDPTAVGKKKVKEQGAIEVLSKARSQCRALIWLTDGNPDFEEDRMNLPWINQRVTKAELIRKTSDYLCKSDPRSGTPLIKSLVTSSESGGGAFFLGALGLGRGTRFDLLQSIVDGSCGGIGHPIGELASVGKPEQLLDALVSILFPEQQPQTTSCAATANLENFSASFHVNEAVNQVRLVIVSGQTDEISLHKVSDPNQTISLLQYGSTSDSSTNPLVRTSSRRLFQKASDSKVYLFSTVTFDLPKNPETKAVTWAGDWAISTGTSCSQNNSARVFLIGDLDLVPTAGKLRRTSSAEAQLNFRLTPRNSQSTSIDTESFDLVSISAKVDSNDVDPSKVSFEDGVLSIRARLRVDQESTSVSLIATPVVKLSKKSADGVGEIELPTMRVDNKEFEIVDRPASPRVVYKQGRTIDKRHLDTHGTIEVTNDDKYLSANVCFQDPDTQGRWGNLLPGDKDRYPKVAIGKSDAVVDGGQEFPRCIHLDPESKKSIPIDAISTKDGIALEGHSLNTAILKLGYRAEYESLVEEERATSNGSVSISVGMMSSKSPGINYLRMMLFSFMALILPLLLMWLFNYAYAGRIRISNGLKVYRREFQIVKGQIRMSNGSLDFVKFDKSQIRELPVAAGRLRTFEDEYCGLSFRPQFYFWRFFAEPHVIAKAVNSHMIVSETTGIRKFDSASGNLVLAGSWYAHITTEINSSSEVNGKGTFIYFHASSSRLEESAREASRAFVSRMADVTSILSEDAAKVAKEKVVIDTPSTPQPVLGNQDKRPPLGIELDHEPKGRTGWRAPKRSKDSSDSDDDFPDMPKSRI